MKNNRKTSLRGFLIVLYCSLVFIACHGPVLIAPKSNTNAITAFVIASPAATGIIKDTDHTINVIVPYETNVTALIPTIFHTGVSISPNTGIAQDFSSPITYTVTAGDGSIRAYVVTVTVARQHPSTKLRIMPLGDSLTVGYTNVPDWSIPFTYGYRGPLYTMLTNAGYQFQFVGSSREPFSLPFGPSFGTPHTILGKDLRSIGQDFHRGYGGATVSQFLTGGASSGSTNICPNIKAVINDDNPDIVLLMVGTNELSDAIINIDALVNTILTTKPTVFLFVAMITPRACFQ